MFCPNCGKSIDENTIFCTNCGFNLKEYNESIKKQVDEASETVVPPVASQENAPANADIPEFKSEPVNQEQQPIEYPSASQNQYYQQAPQQQSGYQQFPNYQYSEPTPIPQKSGSKGLGIAAIILSSLGLIFSITCCLAPVGIIMCIIGLILGITGMRKPATKTLCTIGLILGIAGIVIGVIVLIGMIAAGGNIDTDNFRSFERFFDEFDLYNY